MDYKKLATDIVENIGGASNIKTVTHCMTRIRFTLKDVSKANKEAIEELNGVLGVVYAGGQFMVILGQHLIPVYESVVKEFNLTEEAPIEENLDEPPQEKQPFTWKNAGNMILNYVTAAVTPLIPALIAGGMLKVVLLLIVTFINSGYEDSSSYLLLSAIADAPFYFMPIIVAYGAATKLGGTPIYAMISAAALLHENYTAMVTANESMSLFGINVPGLSYGTSLLPALLIALVAYYAEKFFNKIVPGIFRSVLVGMGTIFVTGSLAFLILGPIGNMLGGGIASLFLFLENTVGPIAVGLLAASLPWLVMMGMHTALAPFMAQLVASPGYDSMIRPTFIIHNMAEGGAVLGVAARTKDKEFRSECISIAIGCIVAGVTEPAIYGINLNYRKPMIGVMAGGLAGGIIASILGAKAFIMGYSNILALPIFEDTILAMVTGILVAIIVSGIVTFVIGFDTNKNKNVTKPVVEDHNDDEIVAISQGTLIDLEDVEDEVFSSKTLGDGIALHLENDIICSPANGTLSTMFPTGHAFGVTTNEGLELLVHIGIDTVKLQGEGFDVLAEQGEKVRAGQPIVRIDREKLQEKGYDLTTMLIFTNTNQEISLKKTGEVKIGEVLN
ncbi:glucose PTS transporter subunit IIA [Tetragenococcus halophilus]|uniref:glucose PTS transporter subunit IIA n=1 Tax=Tetragenococcus halophilus TaxID=51669 RepID=UPI0015BAD249|nr:glucose PTS transporter subunit IIA [Tetragenococcus halophilus]NWO01199.1 PTS transporter subunit EIIC [Tetragenococcus halophilus]